MCGFLDRLRAVDDGGPGAVLARIRWVFVLIVLADLPGRPVPRGQHPLSQARRAEHQHQPGLADVRAVRLRAAVRLRRRCSPVPLAAISGVLDALCADQVPAVEPLSRLGEARRVSRRRFRDACRREAGAEGARHGARNDDPRHRTARARTAGARTWDTRPRMRRPISSSAKATGWRMRMCWRFRTGPGPLTLIVGPASAGKSHLTRIWADIAGAGRGRRRRRQRPCRATPVTGRWCSRMSSGPAMTRRRCST